MIFQMERVQRPKRPYEFYERDILRKSTRLSDSMFVSLFRMNRSTFEILLNEMGPYLPLGASPNGKSLRQAERLQMALFFASGDIPQRHAAFSFNCGKSTVDANNRIVFNAMFQVLPSKYIYLPPTNDAKIEARLFTRGTDLPYLFWGALDGFHVRVCTILLLLYLKVVFLSVCSFLLSYPPSWSW